MSATRRAGVWGGLFMAAGALVVLAAATAWFLIPARYEAYALVKVAEKRPAVLAGEPINPNEFATFKRTQVQLLESHQVLNGTLRDTAINRLASVRRPTIVPAMASALRNVMCTTWRHHGVPPRAMPRHRLTPWKSGVNQATTSSGAGSSDTLKNVPEKRNIGMTTNRW